MILFFLTSGLFLGWSLGANDASHIFGSAVGSKMVSFRKAAIIASVFFILGAVIQGSGTSHTLDKLGSVNASGRFFYTCARCCSNYIYDDQVRTSDFNNPGYCRCNNRMELLHRKPYRQQNSGKDCFGMDCRSQSLGLHLPFFLYIIVKKFKKSAKIHLIRFESYIKTGLIVVGAFGAYSLGANNIANVMGVFVPAFHLNDLNLWILSPSLQASSCFL